jgi:hypothetical protein
MLKPHSNLAKNSTDIFLNQEKKLFNGRSPPEWRGGVLRYRAT